MNITIINASPKIKKSNSEIIINYLLPLLKENRINIYYLAKFKLNEEIKSTLNNTDALIFVFPLYVDSIPSSLLNLLIDFEEKKITNSKTKIYCISNNGFFEGKQNHIAISQIKCWCSKVEIPWGQGLGIGGGEILPHLKKVPLGYGPLKNLGQSLDLLSKNILSLKTDTDIYINPNYFKFLYFLQGSIFWLIEAKKNKLKIKELFKK